MGAPLLSIHGLTKAHPGGAPVLRTIALELAPGDYLAIMGESGSGKSTLLNVIAGLDRADEGEVCLGGTSITRLDDDQATRLRRRHVGFVFQAFHLLPYLSVEANVALPLTLNGITGPEARARTAAMLEAVGLGDRAQRLPRQLSGGEMQRVAIARALVHGPSLVLADEPTGNLDSDSAERVLTLLRQRVKAQAAAAILVTHSLAAAQTADRIAVLRDGQLTFMDGAA